MALGYMNDFFFTFFFLNKILYAIFWYSVFVYANIKRKLYYTVSIWPAISYNIGVCHTLRSWLYDISALIMTLSPGLEKQVRVPRKLSHIHLNVLLFSNPGDNTRIFVKVRGRFVHPFLQIVGPSPLDWRKTGLWNVFLTVLQAPWHTIQFEI